MLDATYPPPVDVLLTLGDPRAIDSAPVRYPFNFNRVEFLRRPDPFRSLLWPDYQDLYGIGQDDIPALIRMVTDKNLSWAGEDTPDVWAPLHAYRALGQLRATEAIEPLISLFDPLDDDDWFNEEIPDVFGLIGPTAIPALATFLADQSHSLFPHATASNALERIGRMHPEARDAAIAALTDQLERFAENDESLNAYIVTAASDRGVACRRARFRGRLRRPQHYGRLGRSADRLRCERDARHAPTPVQPARYRTGKGTDGTPGGRSISR